MAFVVGNGSGETLNGTADADWIQGLGGSDALAGLGGDDVLFGGDGVDLLAGGPGNDFLYGGGGFDLADYRNALGAVTLNLTTLTATGEGIDELLSIEGGVGSALADTLTGDAANNFFIGGGGNDRIDGGPGGNDYTAYSFATGAVTVNLTTGVVAGPDGADVLIGIESAAGSPFDDTLTGSAADNTLRGVGGNDTLDGAGGFDTADYSNASGGVTVSLLAGTSSGSAGTDRLLRFEAITGSEFSDSLIGDASANTLTGLGGDDLLEGGAGDDTLIGGPGFDAVDYRSTAGAVVVDLAAGTARGAGNDTLSSVEAIFGSNFGDTLLGDAAVNHFRGMGGNDLFDGRGGIDWADYRVTTQAIAASLASGIVTIAADGSRDTLVSVEGIIGSQAGDTITGGAGDDFISGYQGNDSLSGGGGIDTVSYRWASGGVTVDLAARTASGADGADALSGFEAIIGSLFADTLTGDGGDNSINGRAGNDLIDGGRGVDTAVYSDASSAVTVDLSAGTASGGDGGDTIARVENVTGSAFGDLLIGSGGVNHLTGGDGNDVLEGGGGIDVLDGGGGTDIASYIDATGPVTVNLATGVVTGPDGGDALISIEGVFGSAFADRLTGGDVAIEFLRGNGGDDVIAGGGGELDWADYQNAPSAVTVSLATGRSSGGDGNDTLIAMSGIRGSNFDDVLTGDAVDNRFRGRGGNDTIAGGDGQDWIDYFNASNGVFVDLSAGTGEGEGTDSLASIEHARGSGFDDWLKGDAGDNIFRGVAGHDLIDGRGGADTARYDGSSSDFGFARSGDRWTVTDGSGAEGVDVLTGVERLEFSDKSFELVNLPRTGVPAYGANSGFLFDAVYYLLDNSELVPAFTRETALQHYLSTGAAQGLDPNSWFDPDYYANRWADLTPLNLDAAILFMHYNLFGVWEGRSAGPKFDKFDGNRYLVDNPDVAAYVDAFIADFLGSRTNGAIAHYVIYGAAELRSAYDTTGVQIDLGYAV